MSVTFHKQSRKKSLKESSPSLWDSKTYV